MTPIESYNQRCEQGLIVSDSEQIKVLQHFERVYAELLAEHHARAHLFAFLRTPHLVKGVYLWGGVGIGKTLLMDCFFLSLPFPEKMRMHFHQFMQMIHDELTKHQGEKDPLFIIAKEISKETMVLCFDELFVSDITDAMLLGRLFKALYARGVSLITTSNVAPDDLYKNGLQRSQFLPAIALLKQHTEVINIPTAIDYRLRHLKEAGVFYTPLDETTAANMEKSFSMLTHGLPVTYAPVMIHERLINIKKQAGNVIWFHFSDICSVPRSQSDYLAISEKYRTVFISDIPIIPIAAKDIICLFISLVDVFYDARIRLVFSAAESVTELYSRGYMVLEYTRTHSRLLEMQSEDYWNTKF